MALSGSVFFVRGAVFASVVRPFPPIGNTSRLSAATVHSAVHRIASVQSAKSQPCALSRNIRGGASVEKLRPAAKAT